MAILNDQVKTLPTVCFLDLTVFTNKQTALSGVTTLKYVDLFDELFGSKVEPAVLHFAQATRTNRLVTSTPVVYRWRDEGVWRTGTDLSRTFGTLGDYTLEIAGSNEYFVLEAGPDIRFTGDIKPPVYTTETPSSRLTHIETWGTTSLKQFFIHSEVLVSVPDWLPEAVTDLDSALLMCRTLNDPNVSNWDVSRVTSLNGTFLGCRGFNQSLNNWDVSNVTTLAGTFLDCQVFNQPLDQWQTSKVTSLRATFRNCQVFNQPIGTWDVSNVKSFAYLFSSAWVFNQPLNDWVTSSVVDLGATFLYAYAFNQPLDRWDVSNVVTLSYTFSNCLVFNQNLNTWNVSNVKVFRYCFQRSVKFDQPLGNWDVSNGDNFEGMFNEAKLFNQPLNTWNTSKATNFARMFMDANAFNQPIDNWYTGKVTTMDTMFQTAYAFNQPVNTWDVSNVTNMEYTFKECIAFNQPMHLWKVSKVTTFREMFFGAKVFNQPINNWQVTGATVFNRMFMGASAFNQPLDGWVMTNAKDVSRMFANCRALQAGMETWDVTGIEDFTYMYSGATVFNADLTAWEVEHIPTEPEGFSGDTYAWGATRKPRWGVGPAVLVLQGVSGTASFTLQSGKALVKWEGETDYRERTTGSITKAATGTIRVYIKQAPGQAANTIDLYAGACVNVENFGLGVLRRIHLDGSRFLNASATFDPAIEEVIIENATQFNDPNISLWDTSGLKKFSLRNCRVFNQPLNGWDVSNVTDFTRVFASCAAFNQDLDQWKPLAATSFEEMFSMCDRFNGKIGDWFNASTKTVRRMFYLARYFNQPLDHLDTSGIEDFSEMFASAYSFNQPLGNWDVTGATTLRKMFNRASVFNQPLGLWSVGHLPSAAFEGMFDSASAYKQDLTLWDVSTIPTEPTDFAKLINNWYVFEKPQWGLKPAVAKFVQTGQTATDEGIETGFPIAYKWDDETHWTLATDGIAKRSLAPNNQAPYTLRYRPKVATDKALVVQFTTRVTEILELSDFHAHFTASDSSLVKVPDELPASIISLAATFRRCRLFNQDISNWAVNNVKSLAQTFKECEVFNQDLSNWKIANVTSLRETFYGCKALTKIPSGNDWSTSNVTDMLGCFRNTKADYSGLALWDTSKVKNMAYMFMNATGTNIQGIQTWNVRNVENMDEMFNNSTMRVDLSAWATIKLLEKPVTFTSNATWPTHEQPYWGPLVEIELQRDTATPVVKIEASYGEGNKWLATDHPNYPLAIIADQNQPFIQMTGSEVPTEGMRVYARIGYDETMPVGADRTFRLVATGPVKTFMFGEGLLRGFSIVGSKVLTTVPSVLPRSITTLHEAFLNCSTFNSPAVSSWDTSKVTSLEATFKGCKAFNQPLTNWTTARVTSMKELFADCELFNQPVDQWDVRLVKSFAKMFYNAKKFHQSLKNWKWTLGEDFTSFLEGASGFYHDLPTYLPKRIDRMESFAKNATMFNGGMAHWPTGAYKKPLDFDTGTPSWQAHNKPTWGTENLLDTPMTSVIAVYNHGPDPAPIVILGGSMNAYWLDDGPQTDLNSDASRTIPAKTVVYLISRYDGSSQPAFQFQNPGLPPGSYVDVLRLYDNVGNLEFNLPDVDLYVPLEIPANVKVFDKLFMGSDRFDDPAVRWWDTSNVTIMRDAFNGCKMFNQHVGWWKTNAVTNMDRMFFNAKVFNQDLRAWYVFQFSAPPVDFVTGATAFNTDYLPNFGLLPDIPEPLD